MLWSDIKSIINAKKKSANLISSLTDKDGNSVNDSSTMAVMFNDFFTNISAKINNSTPHTKKSSVNYLTNRNDKSFFISLTTPEEVEAIIISLNSGKSTGPYSIPIQLLKILSKPVSIQYSEIVKESFLTGVFLIRKKLLKLPTLQVWTPG